MGLEEEDLILQANGGSLSRAREPLPTWSLTDSLLQWAGSGLGLVHSRLGAPYTHGGLDILWHFYCPSVVDRHSWLFVPLLSSFLLWLLFLLPSSHPLPVQMWVSNVLQLHVATLW